MENKDIEEVKKAFVEADRQLLQAEKDLIYLDECMRRFEKIKDNFAALDNFYFGENWLKYRDILQKNNQDEAFRATGEDEIWNVYTDYKAKKVQLLKLLIDDL